MISYRTKQCWTKSGVDTNHVKVDFTRLICLIYIKSENMVWKSGKNRKNYQQKIGKSELSQYWDCIRPWKCSSYM